MYTFVTSTFVADEAVKRRFKISDYTTKTARPLITNNEDVI